MLFITGRQRSFSGGITVENTREICKTDAEILLCFMALKDSGFAFKYAKRENGIFQQYVNCKGKVYGPYDYVAFLSNYHGITEWVGQKGDIAFKYTNDGKDCKTEKINEITQEEIDLLLSDISIDASEIPEENYDEDTHVLRLNRKHQDFFITDKKKYGPYYSITCSEYQNENSFQFIYRKRNNSKNWYYNYNGREIGPFKGNPPPVVYCDEQNRAVVDNISDCNFILINGEKVKCFREAYYACSLYEKNEHQIIVGEASNEELHFKRDGIMPPFAIKNITVLDNGDVAYSKIQADTETWFYNDKQISVSVKGYNSTIYDSIITYKRDVQEYNIDVIPYFMLKGKEYNGMAIHAYKGGFVYLAEGAIQFFPWCVPNVLDFIVIESSEKYDRYCNGMFQGLYYRNQLAGKD